MKKRLVAFLCTCALIFSMIPAVAPVADAATVNNHGVVGVEVDTQMYRVGYGIRSTDPYDPTDYYGTTAAIATVAAKAIENGSTNADRIVKDETTGQFSILLGGYGDSSYRWSLGGMDEDNDGAIDEDDGLKVTCIAVTDPDGNTVLFIAMDNISAQTEVVSAAKIKIYEETGIPLCNIIINASHSHSGPRADYNNAVMVAYKNLMVDSIANAAHDALEDSAFATIEKASYEIDDMNYVRHYVNNGEYKGDNFGPSSISYGDEATTEVSKADNRMHMLRITFDESTGKTPIAFIAWRAHPKCNSTGSNKYGQAYRPYYSSDYVGAFRSYLKAQGYRTSFYQAAAGNINTYSSLYTETKLGSLVLSTTSKTNAATLETSGDYKGLQTGYLYGQELGRQAAIGLSDDSIFTEVSVGKVVAMESVYSEPGQSYPAGLIAAKNQIIADTGLKSMTLENTGGISFPHTYIWPASEGGDDHYYSINSIYHYNAITENVQTGTANLYAVSIGEELAFLTAPNELYDRYDINGSTADEDNDWNELENLTGLSIGTPIFMGYSNGSQGYIPNQLAYSYNENKETTDAPYDSIELSGRGAYEANTSDFAEGAGERIIQRFKTMLTDLYSGNAATVKEAYCDACKQTVDWQPYVGLMGANTMPSGHFYLYEDSASATNFQKTLSSGKTVCLDLNGHTYANQSTVTGRAFVVSTGATLSLMNYAKGTTAYLQGQGSDYDYEGHAYSTREANQNGGVIKVSGGTVNQYSGVNVQRIVADGQTAAQGGTVYIGSGTYNMYGGTISGGQVDSVTVTNKEGEDTQSKTLNDYGGNIYNSGKFNMYDGIITGGKTLASLTTGAGSGGNVYNTGTFVMGKANDMDDASPLITDGTAARYAGNIWQQSGSFTMYSGTITEGSASGVAHNMVLNGGTTSVAGGVISSTLTTKPNIQVNGGKTLTLSGDAVISGPSIKLASATAYVSLGGNFTGSAVVAAASTSNVIGNTNDYTFKPGSLKYTNTTKDIVANSSGELVYKDLSSVSFTTPSKTTYELGEALDVSDMLAIANYGDGTTADVTEGVEVSGYDPNTQGTQTVTLKYLSATETFSVNVVNSVKSISVTTAPTKTSYEIGEALNTAGMVVTATYGNGQTANVTASCEASGFDSSKGGTSTVTLSYTEDGKSVTTTFTVAINKRLASINVTAPAKTAYLIGDAFDTTGMKVTAVYNDGTTETAADYTYDGFDSESVGTKTITVTYQGVTGTYTVTVSKRLVSIAVTAPDKTAYEVNDSFDSTGMVVTATFDAGTAGNVTEDVTAEAKLTGYNMAVTGNQTVTVSYTLGQITVTDTFAIEVTDPAGIPEEEGENVCQIIDGEGNGTYYNTVTDALAAYETDGANYIRLEKDIEGWVNVSETVYIDTNGKDVTVKLLEGGVVYGFETMTNDYHVENAEECGVLTVYGGAPEIEVTMTIDGVQYRYLALPGTNGAYTFHAFQLDTKKGLRPYTEGYGTGLYFQPSFCADSMVAAAINEEGTVDYGIVLTIDKNGELIPVEQTLSAYDFSAETSNDELRVALFGLMPTNAEYGKKEDLSKYEITGQAYFMIGEVKILDDADSHISLREAIKKVDALYPNYAATSQQKIRLDKMWRNYSTVINSWFEGESGSIDGGLVNIGNIKVNISDWFK